MSMSHATAPARALSAEEARRARRSHEDRADALTAGHRDRKQRGERHPVEDFLFTYYPVSPARLRRWHPGWETAYDAAADADDDGRPVITDIDCDGRRSWYRDHAAEDSPAGRSSGPSHAPGGSGGGSTARAMRARSALRRADADRYLRERGEALEFMNRLLTASSLTARRPEFGCFGLHEWAMVHGLRPGQRRHEDLPLRLSPEQTDAVVERERLVCSHVDAFRFFTPSAAPRNATAPTRETQVHNDNPACLHVGMDLYKWAVKLTPLVPSELVLDCFEHARETRVLDMEASPYDVRPLGYGMVPIETAAGKAEYVRRQRELAGSADGLRRRVLRCLAPLVDESGRDGKSGAVQAGARP